MKLYATITSERATKGQGGEWLDIIIKDEQKVPFLILKIYPDPEDSRRYEIESIGALQAKRYHYTEQKGEKQKGE